MKALETLPEYFTPPPQERGDSLGLDFETYRRLARTSLAIIKDRPLMMGLYRLEDGCGLDIFGKINCLTIVIDSAQDQLALFTCGMDAPFGSAVCLLSADTSEKSWRKLLRIAQREIRR